LETDKEEVGIGGIGWNLFKLFEGDVVKVFVGELLEAGFFEKGWGVFQLCKSGVVLGLIVKCAFEPGKGEG
jgi:hypothetical protein